MIRPIKLDAPSKVYSIYLMPAFMHPHFDKWAEQLWISCCWPYEIWPKLSQICVCVCAVLKTCPNLDDVWAFRWFMVFFRKKWPQLYTYASIPSTSGGVQKKSWQPGKKQDLHIVYIHNIKSSLGFMIWFWKKMICKINLFLICSIWKQSTKTKLDFI